jgi:ferritin-like metal-binding protein YciE
MKTLRDLFLAELADMYDAEQRVVKALPKLAKAATCRDLQKALLTHLHETEGHVTKLERVFKSFGEKPRGTKCEATVGLLKEGGELAKENKGSPTINAAIISAGQKVEHHEIAAYGCLLDWATLLGKSEAASLLEEILEQEKNADKTLGELAAGKNEEALGSQDENDEAPKISPKLRNRSGSAIRSGRRDGLLKVQPLLP